MHRHHKGLGNLIILLTLALFLVEEAWATAPGQAVFLFTPEEEEYIAHRGVIKAATFDGLAPLSYIDGEGRNQGVFQRGLDRSGEISGLTFHCWVYNSLEELEPRDVDLIYGIAKKGAPPEMLLSQPFLNMDTVVSIYGVEGSAGSIVGPAVGYRQLPAGLPADNQDYYEPGEGPSPLNQERAGYGPRDPSSIVFRGGGNRDALPMGRQTRQYRVGLWNHDEILLSIINKSIGLIDENLLNAFIGEEFNKAHGIGMVPGMGAINGKETAFDLVLLGVLLFVSIISHVHMDKKLREQNKKYEVLAQISNEYLYEYSIKEHRLRPSEQFAALFKTAQCGKLRPSWADFWPISTPSSPSLFYGCPCPTANRGSFGPLTPSSMISGDIPIASSVNWSMSVKIWRKRRSF